MTKIKKKLKIIWRCDTFFFIPTLRVVEEYIADSLVVEEDEYISEVSEFGRLLDTESSLRQSIKNALDIDLYEDYVIDRILKACIDIFNDKLNPVHYAEIYLANIFLNKNGIRTRFNYTMDDDYKKKSFISIMYNEDYEYNRTYARLKTLSKKQ